MHFPCPFPLIKFWKVAGDVVDGVFLCCPFSHEMSWMRHGTELSQFQTVFLPTFAVALPLTVKYTAVSQSKSLTCDFILSGSSLIDWSEDDVNGISDDFSPKATPCKCPCKKAFIQQRFFLELSHTCGV